MHSQNSSLCPPSGLRGSRTQLSSLLGRGTGLSELPGRTAAGDTARASCGGWEAALQTLLPVVLQMLTPPQTSQSLLEQVSGVGESRFYEHPAKSWPRRGGQHRARSTCTDITASLFQVLEGMPKKQRNKIELLGRQLHPSLGPGDVPAGTGNALAAPVSCPSI